MTARDILLGCKGRLPRITFLAWGLPAFGVALLVYLGLAGALTEGFAVHASRSEGMAGLMVLVLGIFPFVPLLAKRLHDCDLSAWWLVPLATPEILNSAGLAAGWGGTRLGSVLEYISFLGGAGLAMLAAWPGTPGANRFGDAPPGRTIANVG